MCRLRFEENAENAYAELKYNLPFPTDGEEYVFLPACCYQGNQFNVMKKDYPPLFLPNEAKIDMPITITDIPRLNRDGSGRIAVTTGDLSVPCAGVFSKKYKKAALLFTIQEIDGINLGLAYEKGTISISYPHMRKPEMYQWPHMVPSTDHGISFAKGKTIQIPYRVLEFDCDNIKEFFHVFFQNRKCMGLDDKPTLGYNHSLWISRRIESPGLLKI